MKKKPDHPKVAISPAIHKRLKMHCARTGEKLGVAATRAVVEYLRKARK